MGFNGTQKNRKNLSTAISDKWKDPEYREKFKKHPWRSPIRIFENPYNRKHE